MSNHKKKVAAFRSMRRFALYAGFVGVLLTASAQRTAAQFSTDVVSIEEGLPLILQNDLWSLGACRILSRTGESGDPSYIPQLKQIAEMDPNSRKAITHNALYALWLLGEPEDYFLENARAYQQSTFLAYYSILVMAQAPDSTTLLELESLAQASQDGYIHGAVNHYRSVLKSKGRVEALHTFYDKVFELVGQIELMFDMYWVDEEQGELIIDKTETDGYLDPSAVWARSALRALAQQYPDSVAQNIPLVFSHPYYTEKFSKGIAVPFQNLLLTGFQELVEEIAFPDGVPPPAPVLPDLPATLTLATNTASASFSGGSFTLSGFDHTLSGTPNASGNNANAVLATTTEAQQNLLDALANNQQNSIVGLGTAPDIAQGSLDFDPALLIGSLLDLVTDTLTVSHTGTLGSASDPVVAYAPSGLVLSGNFTGTGVLIVDGLLVERGGVEWRGLVIVRADGTTPPGFEMRGNVGVTGGVLLFNETLAAASLVITGNAEVRYSHEVFALLRAALFPTQ